MLFVFADITYFPRIFQPRDICLGRSLAVFARLLFVPMPFKLGNLLGRREFLKTSRNEILLSYRFRWCH
jgi:hypothetical protein